MASNFWWILRTEQEIHRLYPRTYVGRSQRNDIVIANTSVSRYHAIIEATTTSIKITNFGLMGTMINEISKPTATAIEGDFIRMGNVYFQLAKEYIDEEPPTDDERDIIDQILDSLPKTIPTLVENIDITTENMPTQGTYIDLTTTEPPESAQMENIYEEQTNTPYSIFLSRIGMNDEEYQRLLDEYSIDVPNNFNVRYTRTTQEQRNF